MTPFEQISDWHLIGSIRVCVALYLAARESKLLRKVPPNTYQLTFSGSVVSALPVTNDRPIDLSMF